jgi:hypothetical protein
MKGSILLRTVMEGKRLNELNLIKKTAILGEQPSEHSICFLYKPISNNIFYV